MSDNIKFLICLIPILIIAIILIYQATKYHLWVWYPKEWAGKTKKDLKDLGLI
jgi:hypothetical protein